jgi:hypothetical protein
MPGVLKIGKTTRDAGQRARELSTHTGVPTPFRVDFVCEVQDCDAVEAAIHARLTTARVNEAREFFKLPSQRLWAS